MSISESDWKKFKGLRALALDRFCLGVLADAKTISMHGGLSAHARYGMLYDVIHDRNRDMAGMFDYYSRSTACSCLALMVHHDLLTEAELAILSDETRVDISYAVRQPYELEWVEERLPLE